MSYILDALMKADRERQNLAVPGLHTQQMPVLPTGRRSWTWPVLIAGTTFLAGLFFLVWGHFNQRALSTTASGSLGTESVTVAATAPTESRTPPAAAVIEAPPAKTDRRREAAAAPARLPVAIDEPAKPGRRLYGLAELPPALQQEARKITVSGFAQASGATAPMAIINDRAWREGDEVTEGLRVESISADGVVFNLKGYRFRKGGA